MIISSDITRVYPFTQVSEIRNVVSLESTVLSTGNLPLWTIELDKLSGESNLKIKKHSSVNGKTYIYKVKFDGVLDSPGDLNLLFRWLKIESHL